MLRLKTHLSFVRLHNRRLSTAASPPPVAYFPLAGLDIKSHHDERASPPLQSKTRHRHQDQCLFQNPCLRLSQTHNSLPTEFFSSYRHSSRVASCGKQSEAPHSCRSSIFQRENSPLLLFPPPVCLCAASLYRISYQKSLGLDKVLPYSSVFNNKVPHTHTHTVSQTVNK